MALNNYTPLLLYRQLSVIREKYKKPFFVRRLNAGHPFAHAVHKKGRLFLNSGEDEMATETVSAAVTERNHCVYMDAQNKVTEFIAGADHFMVRKQTKLAAFMLHQAAEQCLHALFEIGTGMYLNTHSIDKLLRYSSMACYRS